MIEPGRQRQFHIHHCLGRGGYGEVYRATMVSPGGLSTDVAVKLLRVDVDPGAEAVRRLRDEGRMLAMLRHPAILRVFDLALLDGRVGLVTEYVEGQDLTSVVGRIPPKALVEVVATVAEALDVAWNHVAEQDQPLRLVHRDVKPSNVRIGRHGEVKLLDFGIARSTTEEVDREARTGTGSTVGSLAYMAPERFTRAPSAPAADVYGLGCTLYEGLCGRRLFEEAIPVEMFRLAADPHAYAGHLDRALALVPANTDAELVDLVRRMLAHAPGQRPTAAEVRTTLEALVDRVPGEPLRKWARQREWPKPVTVPGFLDGRTLTEGTLTGRSGGEASADDRSSDTFRMDLPPAGETTTQPAVKPASGGGVPWLGVVAILLMVITVGAATAIALQPGPPPAPVQVPVPVPVPVPVEVLVPTPSPVVAPTPEPVPVPVVEGPRPRPRPDPAPDPVPVVVEPTPGPAPVAKGSVRAEPEGIRIQLRSGATVLAPAGELPVGRYELWVDFGSGFQSAGVAVDVLQGRATRVKCNVLRQTCDVGD